MNLAAAKDIELTPPLCLARRRTSSMSERGRACGYGGCGRPASRVTIGITLFTDGPKRGPLVCEAPCDDSRVHVTVVVEAELTDHRPRRPASRRTGARPYRSGLRGVADVCRAAVGGGVRGFRVPGDGCRDRARGATAVAASVRRATGPGGRRARPGSAARPSRAPLRGPRGEEGRAPSGAAVPHGGPAGDRSPAWTRPAYGGGVEARRARRPTMAARRSSDGVSVPLGSGPAIRSTAPGLSGAPSAHGCTGASRGAPRCARAAFGGGAAAGGRTALPGAAPECARAASPGAPASRRVVPSDGGRCVVSGAGTTRRTCSSNRSL